MNEPSHKPCSICGVSHLMTEYSYGSRDDNSYCKSCCRDNRAAYAKGGVVAARMFREEMRGKWKSVAEPQKQNERRRKRDGAARGGDRNFTPHTNRALKDAFAARPFQGATPESARFLFIGLDANYSDKIDQSPILFGRLLEYLEDGIAFWKERKVHHPFLLDDYRGDGWKYHQTFAQIGFRPEHAAEVSFVELLHVPTVGREPLKPADLNPEHLRRINSAIEGGNARYVFISSKVASLMRAFSLFDWLSEKPVDDGSALRVWGKRGSAIIYWHYHFSYPGKPLEKEAQRIAIRNLIEGRG